MPAKKSLEGLKIEASIERDGDRLHVNAFARGLGLDREKLCGWSLKSSHEKLAQRLVRAIHAGVVYEVSHIARDINNQSYLVANAKVHGRCMNADLRRLGF